MNGPAGRPRRWWQRRRWMRAELRFLEETIARDLEAAGLTSSLAGHLARRRLSAGRGRAALLVWLSREWDLRAESFLSSFVRGPLEPWVWPALMLTVIVGLAVCGPHSERIRAGLANAFPYPDTGRLAVFSLYPPEGPDPPSRFSPLEAARQVQSIEQSAVFREVRVTVGRQVVAALETSPNFDAVLGALPRAFAFPQVRLALPWREGPQRRVSLLARLKPGAGIGQARQELMSRKGIGWVTASTLADRNLRRPLIPALFWALPVLLLSWRLVEDLFRERRMALYRAYALFGLVCRALLSAVAWVAGLEVLAAAFPVASGTLSIILSCFFLVWLLGSALALLRWGRDVEARCRTCFRRLRLPVEEGEWGAILIRPKSVESICPWGHGHLVVDRLSARWTFSGDYWQELTGAVPSKLH